MSERFVQVHPNQYEFDFTRSDKVIRTYHSAKSQSTDPVVFGRYSVDDVNVSKQLGQLLSPLLADCIDVALFVYLADRLSPRRERANPHHTFQWGRKLRL